VLRAYGVTDKGRVRATNEDDFAIEERLRLCVVADGMGGHNAGEVAARLAVDAIVEFVRESRASGSQSAAGTWPFGFDRSLSEGGNRLRTAIHLANVQILEAAGSAGALAGMGTTVVAALVEGHHLSVGHVGDSRLYLVVNDRIRQLTHDDSWVAKMLAQNPDADPAVLDHHPMRNALTNVVGARARIDVHVVERTLSGGERLVLSTDGVHGVLDEHQMERIVLDSPDLTQMSEGLVGAALARGSRDNCTAVVARYFAN
jgi:serine/threonine protein phosphatase PrpC